MANHFGRRKLLLSCVAGFTLTSLFCGLATSLPELIVFRVLQGLTGGGLQPLAQAIMLESFPQQKHGHAMAAYGIGVLLAPILGPTLGGWITDNYSWRWIFYLNIPVGAFSLFMMSRFVFDPPYIKRKAGGIDAWGIGFLALSFGTLQVVLDTGQRKDWFSSDYIRFFSIVCVISLIALVIRELKTAEPVVDLRALAERSFSTGVFLISMLGFVLYASLVLLPIYLQTLLGYPALMAGLALSPRGLGSLLTTPLAGYLTSKTDPRKLLFFGLVLGSITMFDLSGLNLNSGYWNILRPQIFQGIALSFLFIPLMAASMAHISKERMGNATSIFNLTRNIGGSLGIALMTTFLARRGQVHQNHLVSHITAGDLRTRQMLAGLASRFHSAGSDSYTASRKALAALSRIVQQQASMLAFVEAFWIMGVIFLAMVPFIFLMRRTRTTPIEPTSAKPHRQPSEVEVSGADQISAEREEELVGHVAD